MTQRAKDMLELAMELEAGSQNLAERPWSPWTTETRIKLEKAAKALRLAAQADAPGGEPAAVKATPYWTYSTCDAPLSCAECGVEQPNDSMYYDGLIVENKRLRDLVSGKKP